LIGVGGIVTFKNSVKLVDVVKEIGIESIVVETDSPYLSPEPYRGKRNEPKNVDIIYKKICDIKDLEYNYLCDRINSNVFSVLSIVWENVSKKIKY
jgi:TatD DNase family protein